VKQVIVTLAILVAIIATIWYVGLADYLTISILQQKSEYFLYMVNNHYIWSVTLFLLLCSGGIFLGLPVVIPLTMLGGFVFGLWWGMFYSVLSATIGSLCYFLLIRYTLFGKTDRYISQQPLTSLQTLVKNHGSHYLLILHFIIIVPYIAINTMAAVSNVSLSTFVWTTVIGALPSLFLYSFAGRQLTIITSWYDIIQPPFLLVLCVLVLCTVLSIIYTQKMQSNQT